MKNVAKAATGLMLATLLAKVLGFGREIVLGGAYGVSAYSDAFIVAFNMPTIIFASIGAALATTYIPIYFDVRNKNGNDAALKLVNNIFNIVAIICVIIALLGVFFTEPIVKIFAVGFEDETLRLAVQFTRILMPSVLFIGLSYIITAYLQIHDNFTIPGLVSIPKNIIIIVSIILSVKFNSNILAFGTLIAIASELLFQIPFAIKKGYKYQPYVNPKDENIKKILILVMPIFIGATVGQINVMIDRTLASTLAEGSIAALNYANKLNGFVIAIFITSISAVIYPTMAKLSTDNNKGHFKETLVKSVNSIVLFVLPITVGAIVLAEPIVQVLFQRGAFDQHATEMTYIALVFYAIGLPSIGLTDILSKAFYAIKDTKTPMMNGIITVGINIILNFIFIKHFKHAGLALATSIANVLGLMILFIRLKIKIEDFGQKSIIITIMKCLISSIGMGVIAKITYDLLIQQLSYGLIGQLMSLAISVVLGAIAYFLFTLILKVKEVQFVTKFVMDKLKKNK